MTTTTDQAAANPTAASPKTMSESEFLDAQAAEAQAAVQQTWDDLKSTLKDTASLEVWAKRHPWMVAGAAVAGGFLVATLLFSSPEPVRAETDDDEPDQTAASRPRRLSWLIGPLFGLLRPIFGQLVSSLLAAGLGAMTASMADADRDDTAASDTNGAGPLPGEGPVPD